MKTLEITESNSIYLDGNIYNKEMAMQVMGHWLALGMIDGKTYASWINAIQKPN
jgi:hypothetical protein